jgi:hypothetical protein
VHHSTAGLAGRAGDEDEGLGHWKAFLGQRHQEELSLQIAALICIYR